MENHPHYRVEYIGRPRAGVWSASRNLLDDLQKLEQLLAKVGQFAFIPEGLECVLNSVEEAFEKLTGIDRQHIIHYSTDERFRSDGMEWIG